MIKVEAIEYSIILTDFPRLVFSCYYSNDSIDEVKEYYQNQFKCKLKDDVELIGKSIKFNFFEDIETIQEMINHIELNDYNFIFELKSDIKSTRAAIESLRRFDLSNSRRSKYEESLDKDGEV
jgi:hypothetical protein